MKSFTLLLAFMLCAPLCTSTYAAAKRPADVWSYYQFNGSSFVAGVPADGKHSVAVREKLLPVVMTGRRSDLPAQPLPEGAGAIAGICYLQISGGKLGGEQRFSPYANVTIQISSGGRELTPVETDANGYYVFVLPAGRYAVGSGSETAEITVVRGVTTLAPLRAGKRMAD